MKKQVFIIWLILILITLQASIPHLIAASKIEQKKAQISQVKQVLDELNVKMEQAVEEYNQAATSLGAVKQKLQINQNKMADNQIELQAKNKALGSRVKALYKEDSFFTLKVLFQASSFRELLDGLFLISRIIYSDKQLLQQLRTVKRKLSTINRELSVQKSQQESLVNKVAAKKVEVDEAVEAKNRLLATVKKELAQLQAEERERIRRVREEALRKLREQKLREQQSQSALTEPSFNGDGSASKSDVVEIAKKYLGVPYRWGGTSPETGFDCSGFTWYVYRQVGVYLPRTSSQQHNYLLSKGRGVGKSNLAPGDLVFYGRGSVTDVKMYMGSGYIIGANGGQFIPGEVKILPLDYRSDYFGAGRP